MSQPLLPALPPRQQTAWRPSPKVKAHRVFWLPAHDFIVSVPCFGIQVLGQRYTIACRERDELRGRLQDSVRGAQQKSGFRNLILERKLGGLAEEAEKRDACVKEVRTLCHDPGGRIFFLPRRPLG